MPAYACGHGKCVYKHALMPIISHLLVILFHQPTSLRLVFGISSCADCESALYVLYHHAISWLPSTVNSTNDYAPSYPSPCKNKY